MKYSYASHKVVALTHSGFFYHTIISIIHTPFDRDLPHSFKNVGHSLLISAQS